MPLFYFVLKAGRDKIPDREGLEFHDLQEAQRHAIDIARELMRNRTLSSRAWRIEVRDDYLLPRGEVLFAEVDQSLDEVGPQTRETIRFISRYNAALNDAVVDVKASLGEVRASFARIERLVAEMNTPLLPMPKALRP
ncbi:MAG TPA: hypothetical protein VFB45_25300 [Pseudolabrys sp.]|nr:hypothetical protein [Pseudolabrys sp.]